MNFKNDIQTQPTESTAEAEEDLGAHSEAQAGTEAKVVAETSMATAISNKMPITTTSPKAEERHQLNNAGEYGSQTMTSGGSRISHWGGTNLPERTVLTTMRIYHHFYLILYNTNNCITLHSFIYLLVSLRF